MTVDPTRRPRGVNRAPRRHGRARPSPRARPGCGPGAGRPDRNWPPGCRGPRTTPRRSIPAWRGRRPGGRHQPRQHRMVQRGGRPGGELDQLPPVAGLEMGVQELPQRRLGLLDRAVGGEPVVDEDRCLVRHHVGGTAAGDVHHLELLDVRAPVEHRAPTLVGGDRGQQRGQSVDGVAARVRPGGVGLGPGQFDPHPHRALAAGLDDAGRSARPGWRRPPRAGRDGAPTGSGAR